MKKLTMATLLLATNFAHAGLTGIDVIYGEDNRKDVYEVSNALHLKLAQSTAGMVHLGQFAKTDVDSILNMESAPTLEEGQNICPTEAFSQQLTAPACSGFLVGPNTLVTAGHCYASFDTPENVCSSFAWVFDYNMKSEKHDPTKGISIEDIYLCKKVEFLKLNATTDFAVIKLHRNVKGREPLKFRTSGKVDNKAELLVIGHPSGLPTKISAAGKITKNKNTNHFSTTLDTFHGNSGSAVFDAKSGLLEGILIQGKTDYKASISDNPSSCKVLNRCDDTGINCSAGEESGPVAHGEVVLRISEALSSINAALKP